MPDVGRGRRIRHGRKRARKRRRNLRDQAEKLENNAANGGGRETFFSTRNLRHVYKESDCFGNETSVWEDFTSRRGQRDATTILVKINDTSKIFVHI